MEKRLSKEERKKLLKKAGYTKEEIKDAWEECLQFGFEPVVNLKAMGHTWKDLPADVMTNLPNIIQNYKQKLFEDDVKQVAPSLESICQQLNAIEFEDNILDKIDANIPLSENEIKELLFDGYEIDRKVGENRRWSRTVKSVVEVNERTFLIEWEEGLTECQENEFYTQPIEVRKQEYEKMVKVTEWIPIDKEEREVDEDEIEME